MGLLGLGATMAQGFAFGTGSALARTAVDAVFSGGSKEQAPAAPAPVAPQQPQSLQTQQPQYSGACSVDQKAFTDCLHANAGNAGSCDYYFNALKACQESNI